MAKARIEPTEVLISETQKSVPVTITESKFTTAQEEEVAKSSDRQKETELGQRNINLIWETTQSRIALMVVAISILLNSIVVALVIFDNHEVTVTQLALVSICLQFVNMISGIVVGFYFSRTNHQNRGGVGSMPEEPYVGR